MKMVELGEVCDIIAGQSPPSKFYNQNGNGLPFFQGKADFGEMFPTVRYWTTKTTKKSIPGDILFSVRAPVGPTNLNNIESCIGRGLAAIRVTSKIDSGFLLHYLRGNEKIISDRGTGSTFKAITIKNLKSLQIPLPPLPVQQRIAAILDKADALRQKDQELIRHYEQLSQSLFLEMFGDPVTNEKGWEVDLLRNLCEKITDGTHHSPEPKSSGFHYVTAKHVKPYKLDFYSKPTYIDEISHKEIISRCLPEFGDVLVIKDGATTGAACINTFKEPISLLSSLALLSLKKNALNNYYIVWLLNFDGFKQSLIRKYMSGAAIQRYTLTKIKVFRIPVPPLALQNQFADRVKKIEEQKAQAEQAARYSEELFQSLLQGAFSRLGPSARWATGA